MNKRGGIILKFIFIFFILLLLLIFLRNVNAEIIYSVDIVNVTLIINATGISINVSNSVYYFNNTPSVIFIQQNFSIAFEQSINISNATITANITCLNTSVALSCSCPSCPSIGDLNCSFPSTVSLNNETKTEFFNHYSTKLEDIGNKVSENVIFKLEPTKAEIEQCRQGAFNASLKQNEAERQRDEQLKNNQVITGFYDSCKNEKRTLQAVFFGFIAVAVISAAFFMGFFERFGAMFGGGRF